MENKNKVLVGSVIILAICVLGLAGYIVYDKTAQKGDNKPNVVNVDKQNTVDGNNNYDGKMPLGDSSYEWNNGSQSNQEIFDKYFSSAYSLKSYTDNLDGTEMGLVKNDISKLFAYLNGTIYSEVNGCHFLSYSMDLPLREDYLRDKQTKIMECMYGTTLEEIDEFMIMSSDQYNTLKEYFMKPVVLEKADISREGYLYAYGIGDMEIFPQVFFDLVSVVRDNGVYKITVNAYYRGSNNIKKSPGKLEVKVVDGHLKYGQLIFK